LVFQASFCIFTHMENINLNPINPNQYKHLVGKKIELTIDNEVWVGVADYIGIVFAMLDGKDYSKSIWKLIKPKYEKPFSSKVWLSED